GSARSGTPTIASPSGSSPGTSLAEWTARSTSLASSASSISLTKRDLSSCTAPRSPEVVIGTSSASTPSSRSASRISPLWASASALPRVPIRIDTPGSLPQLVQTAGNALRSEGSVAGVTDAQYSLTEGHPQQEPVRTGAHGRASVHRVSATCGVGARHRAGGAADEATTNEQSPVCDASRGQAEMRRRRQGLDRGRGEGHRRNGSEPERQRTGRYLVRADCEVLVTANPNDRALGADRLRAS